MHGGNFPSNVQYLQSLVNKLSNMNFEKVDEILKKIFDPVLGGDVAAGIEET